MTDQTAERALPDEAVEAVARDLHGRLGTGQSWESLGKWRQRQWLRGVRAAAPLLVEAGRREVLDGLKPMWGARNPGSTGVQPFTSREDAEDYAKPAWAPHAELEVVECRRTEWQAVDGAGQ